jgi:peroxiredoxin
MTESLTEQLAVYTDGWRARVPAERQQAMAAHIAHLAESGIARTARQVGDQAPLVRLPDQTGAMFDLQAALAHGPVVLTFYRGGWCPFCNFELKAYQAVLPEISALGASLVAVSPEKPEDTAGTAAKNEVSFPILSDIGQAVGRAFGVVYAFTEELRGVYDGFKLDIPSRNGTPDDWSLPLSATYVIGKDNVILFADTRVDYRERTDPQQVLAVLAGK